VETLKVGPVSKSSRRLTIDYRMIWRWHFYAGLFCVPFVMILAISGAMYLFKPQIDALLDSPFDRLAVPGQALATPSAQVQAALQAIPKGQLASLEVRQDPTDAARVLVRSKGELIRVYVHPNSARVLKILPQESRFMDVVHTIHGELLMGKRGSILVELADNWAIVMIVTGLYLWWPRGARGLAGVLWPRLGLGRQLLWRDLHAVTGMWVSVLALFLLISALPWTEVWNDGFKKLRTLTGTASLSQDWSKDRASEHAEHMAEEMGMSGASSQAMAAHLQDMSEGLPPFLDRAVLVARNLDLPPPVLVSPPSAAKARNASPDWTIRSDTQNRPQRVTISLDPVTAEEVERQTFQDKHPIDQVIGFGIAAHEGQLFGWPNQLLGLLSALGLMALSVSGYVLWWRRRPQNQLGAPQALGDPRIGWGLAALILCFAVLLPVLGASMILVALAEQILHRLGSVSRWLGLRSAKLTAS